ncbi:MAG: hypothetical protein MUC48_18470 [Leptolyngbya sp. Prado105]|jgi:hypothetical protein|nr:hypothetical protein [Leptolyngbya sp. Prado105]
MASTLAPQDTQNWLHSSVQTFFSTCNWENQPQRSIPQARSTAQDVAFLEQAAATESFTELSFELKVKQFFAAMNWEGAAVAGVSVAPEPDIQFDEPNGSFTLTDFSDLF